MRECLARACTGIDELAAPAMGVGLDEPELGVLRARGTKRHATAGARDRRREVVTAERLFRRPHVRVDRALFCAAAFEVLGKHERIALARALEPVTRELV